MTRRSALGAAALLTILLLAALPGAAQTPFAMSGLGQNVEMASARDTGRGGWGMATTDTLTPGTRNPAALADLRFSDLVFTGYGETARNTGDGETRTTRRVIVPNIRLAIPLQRSRLALHAGFQIQRSMEWVNRTPVEYEHFGETVRGTQRYERTGTLWRVPLGLAWRPIRGFAINGSYNWERGSITDFITQIYTDPEDNYYLPSSRGQTDDLRGQSWSVSVLVDALHFLQLGATYTASYNLGADREINLAGVAARSYDHLDYTMPAEYKAGLMLRLPSQWRFGADGQFAPYSEFSGRSDWEEVMEDEWTVSAGFDRPLVRAKQGRGYTMPVRVGAFYRQWAQRVGGEPVTETTFSAGTGFPFSNRFGMIDLSLSYSMIGDEAKNGYESNVWRFAVTITGLEPLIF